MTAHTFDNAVRLLNDRTNLERLQTYTPQDMQGRLDTLRQILNALGNPETKYQTAHVAGTKGKGSTCVMLESILRESGYRVGRYSSPHLYSFTERLVIDGIACPADEFTKLFFDIYNQVEPAAFQSLTYFELLTLLAFVYFAQQQVDVAIMEVGLGGRLDATNLCRPYVSVITSISYDHIAQLGPTLADIAAEKSGIIKPGVPVVTAVRHTEALSIIRNRAQSLHSPLYVIDEDFFVRRNNKEPATASPYFDYTFQYESRPPKFPIALTLNDISLQMPGVHQIDNASAAISAGLLLPLPPSAVRRLPSAFRHAYVPLRVEIIRLNNDSPTFIFDGAHNRASMCALMQTALELFPNRRMLLIFGATLDKDIEGMFAEIDGRFYHVFLTQVSDSSRRFPPHELRTMLTLPEANVSVVENCRDAWEQCLRIASKDDVICITGSLYLAAELRTQVPHGT
jgi:dihydrofolate synthase/folylpolyglutamate synthase